MLTIPEIAETLRHHVNHDNRATQLIIEHILPVIDIHVDSEDQLTNSLTAEDCMSDMAGEVTTIRKSLYESVRRLLGDSRLASISIRLDNLAEEADDDPALQDLAVDVDAVIEDLKEFYDFVDSLKELADRMDP